MRKIDEQSAHAFIHFNGRHSSFGNTKVSPTRAGDIGLYLHGNKIAEASLSINDKLLSCSLAGYNTQTTRARLNGLLEYAGITYSWYYYPIFYQKKGLPYIRCYVRDEDTRKDYQINIADVLVFDRATGYLETIHKYWGNKCLG